MLNPFVHKLKLDNLDKLKIAILTVILLPFRLIGISILLILAYILACIALHGLTQQNLQTHPICGYRRSLRNLAALCLRGMYWFGSFNRMKVIGKQANSKDAPILVCGPHSSFFDAFIFCVLNGPPSALAKAQAAHLPFFGKLINLTQPIYVWREDPNSRQNTIKNIINRAKSDEEWPQIVIFPEGTCTNRSCLLTFKPGSFYPAVPVQPVCIRYTNKLDTITWTWVGAGAFKLLWMTLTQLNTNCEVHLLPVYRPNEEEIKDPKLYANNVRTIMAKALDIPLSEYRYEDFKIMLKAQKYNLPHSTDIIDIFKLRQKLGLNETNIEEKIVSSYLVNDVNYMVTIAEFALRLQISMENPSTSELYSIFRLDQKLDYINFREYLLDALFLINFESPIIDYMYYVSKLYDDEQHPECITISSLRFIIQNTLTLTIEQCDTIFRQIVNRTNRDFITFDELKDYLSAQPEFSNIFTVSK